MYASNSHSYTHLILALGIVREPTVWVFITLKYPGIHDIGLLTQWHDTIDSCITRDRQRHATMLAMPPRHRASAISHQAGSSRLRLCVLPSASSELILCVLSCSASSALSSLPRPRAIAVEPAVRLIVRALLAAIRP